MQVFQTAGVPPNSGSSSLPTIGWTRKSRKALTKSVAANNSGTAGASGWNDGSSVEIRGGSYEFGEGRRPDRWPGSQSTSPNSGSIDGGSASGASSVWPLTGGPAASDASAAPPPLPRRFDPGRRRRRGLAALAGAS